MEPNSLIKTAIEVLMRTSPLISPIVQVLVDSAKDIEIASETGEIVKLEEEGRRQTISLEMARLQAQVAQEAAIAHRIEHAEEVEIEEYYENDASAGLSGSTDGMSAELSLGGRGRRVTKRIYRFTGKQEHSNRSNSLEGET